MSIQRRRIIGVVLALLALGGGALLAGSVRATHERALRNNVQNASEARRLAAREWLESRLKTLESQAVAAASLTPIKSHVVSFDAATLHDGFQSETWWDPFRRAFSVYGLALDGEVLDVVDGMGPTEFVAPELIKRARQMRQASMYLRAGAEQWPYAAVAAVVDLPRPVQAVLVLGKAIDQSFLADMSEKLGGAFTVSDGQATLLGAGPDAERATLAQAMGQESAGFSWGEDGTSRAAAVPLVPGLTIWTHATLPPQQIAEYRRDARTGVAIVWAASSLAAIAALLFAFRGGTPVPSVPSREFAAAEEATDAYAPAAFTTGRSDPSRAAGSGRSDPSRAAGSGRSDPSRGAATGRSDPRGRGALQTPADTRLTPGVTDPDAAAGDEGEGATAVQRVLPAPDPANVFGRYVLLDRLGEGGMAEVYTAVAYGAENFRRNFVIKRLRPEMTRNPDVVSSFIDEANLASSLVHSNIVPVFDFGKMGDEYFLAQEYILGRDLGRVNRRALEREQKPLPLAQVFYVAHETLEALDYAHNRASDDGKPLNIVHRDISPNNILVSARGEVKLFDFGIAKSEGRLTQTSVGLVKGNVRFMSPEQARGEAVDGRSDLFALGLVIYYALAGDALYKADTSYNLLIKAAHGLGAPELEHLASLPKEAQRVLERALQANPADRFQSAQEFAVALAPLIAGQQAAMGRTMDRLFGADIATEQARFAAAAAGGSAPAVEPLDPAGGTARFAAPKE